MNDYNIDDLFFSVNDIYEQWDEGRIPDANVRELFVKCCKAFIQFNDTPQREAGQRLEHKIDFKTASDCYLWLDENEMYNPVTLTIHLGE